MQLTKLEIKGFKSFGDKVVINFDKGVTGIVGPNGCGKSNVVDSIRWVLGEQRIKTLRSEKMENIIFNGTKNRKATQLSEVSLTFDNTKNLLPTEYSQVTITRRYYRSGDSEYELNGVTCRLKDIQNLFMDTGINSNSYSIIELGMVDEILNDKENSRRHLFEEAAGISKFRKRRKETMRKLETTDVDLDRVEDLLFEIEKNLKSLEKQAKQARKYFKSKEEYKQISIQLARVTLKDRQLSFDEVQKRLTAESDKKIQLNRELNEKHARIEQMKADLVGKEKLLASRQKSLNAFVEKIREQESEKQLNSERLTFLQERSQQLNLQINRDQDSIGQLNQSLESLRKQHLELRQTLKNTAENVACLKEEYEAYRSVTEYLRGSVADTEKKAKEKREFVYQSRKSIEIKQVQLSNFNQELEQSSADASSQQADLSGFDEHATELKYQLDDRKARLQELENAEQALQTKINSVIEEISQEKETLIQINRKKDAIQNEFNLTKSLVENMEGFPDAIRYLKIEADWGKDVPLLSDIITCQDKYKVAIENFLGAYMNYYVVNNHEKALQGIHLLHEADKGKANFFVLNQLPDLTTKPGNPPQGSIPALDIVEFGPAYRNLMHHILDRVYILENSNSPASPPQDGITLVTEDGHMVQKPYSISGGSVGSFEGKRVGRAKNLETLTASLTRLADEAAQLEAAIAAKSQEVTHLKESSYKQAIADIQREMNQLNEEFISTNTRQEQTAAMVKNNEKKREHTLDQERQLQDEVEDARPQLLEAEGELHHLEEELKELSTRLSSENEELSNRSSAYNQENILYYQEESRVKSLEQEITYKEESLDSRTQSIEDNYQELQENETAYQELKDKKGISEEELYDMYAEKEEIEKGVNEAERDYYALRGDIDKTEKSTRDIQQQRENADTLIMELQNKQNDTKLSINSVKERLSVEFEIELDAILQEEEPPSELFTSIAELQDEAQKLKDRIQRIGPINPMAMEAYEEIKERYDFISSEREDLLQAKASLLETIDEIDTVAKQTFLDAFGKIKENFGMIFRSLFNEEDQCDLLLTDPHDPLNSSIDIQAKPKGKKPLTINQLSGGEKTLTAISLLFAIYLLKPAPFCIFDEVDAPLDDTNIDKFNQIIKKFSKESQFIIVTHNKRTMVSTDIIYGITMIEQGVSRVVPVDMRELVEQ